jgi:hypothetical protein
MSTDDIKSHLTAQLGTILERHVEPIFKPGTKLTVIARTPGNNEADVLVTNDDINELAALVARSKAREEVPAPPPLKGRAQQMLDEIINADAGIQAHLKRKRRLLARGY